MSLRLTSIGADPEVFLALDDEIISAEGIVGGTKADPREIEPGFCVQEHNVLLEYNIPACNSRKAFVSAIHHGLDLAAKAIDSKYEIKIIASHVMDDKWLQSEQAKEFGCSPDFDCYIEDENPRPNSQTNLRTAGGHVHIGFEDVSIDNALRLVKLCDLFLGVPSILMDSDNQRRSLYGKAGAFRFREYGKTN